MTEYRNRKSESSGYPCQDEETGAWTKRHASPPIHAAARTQRAACHRRVRYHILYDSRSNRLLSRWENAWSSARSIRQANTLPFQHAMQITDTSMSCMASVSHKLNVYVYQSYRGRACQAYHVVTGLGRHGTNHEMITLPLKQSGETRNSTKRKQIGVDFLQILIQ